MFDREYNEKCIAISGLAVLAYFTLPVRRASVAVGVAVGTYVAIAWYDEAYACEERLQAFGGIYGAVTAPLKPAVGVDGRYGSGAESHSRADCPCG